MSSRLEYYKVTYLWIDKSAEAYVGVSALLGFSDELLTYEIAEMHIRLYNYKALKVRILTWVKIDENGYESLSNQLRSEE